MPEPLGQPLSTDHGISREDMSTSTRGSLIASQFLALASLILLFAPAWVVVHLAVGLADALFAPLSSLLAPMLEAVARLPSPLDSLLGGNYGVIAMLPFLLLYALPTILFFALFIALYDSSGLMSRLAAGLQPWLAPFGLAGSDLARVVMGFGCNVPAVGAARACHSCSRSACVSAISFGAACSYQLPATLAVFAAAGLAWMGTLYLAVLGLTTLTYLRFTTSKASREAARRLLVVQPRPLRAPDPKALGAEVLDATRSFFVMALPVFVSVCFVAALLEAMGALALLAQSLGKVMLVFNLPPEAALAVALGSVRKDGLAIGLLDSEWGELKVALDSPSQVLAAAYLAGVLLPCLVTLLAIGREMGSGFAAKLALRQAVWVSGFSLAIAWGGYLIEALS